MASSALSTQPEPSTPPSRSSAGLDDMASSALSQAVATIQQLTEDVAEQHRTRQELEAERDELRQSVMTLEKKTRSSSKLAQMWKQIDSDDSGELDSQELRKVMVLMGQDESTLDMDATMAALDKDDSGSVSFGEFQTWWDMQDQAAQSALTSQLQKVSHKIV